MSGLHSPSCNKQDICSDDGRYPIVRQLASATSLGFVERLLISSSSSSAGSVSLRFPKRFCKI